MFTTEGGGAVSRLIDCNPERRPSSTAPKPERHSVTDALTQPKRRTVLDCRLRARVIKGSPEIRHILLSNFDDYAELELQ
jgi:hypothetical protein